MTNDDAMDSHLCSCCSSVLSLVQFLFSFVLFYVNIIMITNMKQKKTEVEPRIKLNYNIYKMTKIKQRLVEWLPLGIGR